MNKEALRDGAFYFVEATSFEMYALQQRVEREFPQIKWESESSGDALEIGNFGGMPIWMQFTYAYLNGEVICFWEMCSLVCHYGMAEEWLKKNYPYQKKCDAGGFVGQCLYEINREYVIERLGY